MRMLAATLVSLVLVAVGEAAAAPKDQACELMSYMAIGDMEGARSYWDDLIAHWDPAQRKEGTENIFRPLQDLRLEGLSVFRTLDLPNVAEEFLATSALKGGGQLYFRIFFEKWDGELRLVNFRYQQDFEKISVPAFVQTPAAVSCG